MSIRKLVVRSGVAVASWRAGVLRLRTTGRAARTKGRMRWRMIGAASMTKGRTAWLATLSSRTAGRSLSAVGRRTSANVWTLPRVDVVVRSAPGKSRMAREMFVSSEAKARNTVAEAEISCLRSPPRWASAVFSRCSELISRRRFCRRTATAVVTRAMSRLVGSKRRKTSCRSLPRVCRPWPAPLTSSFT